MTDYRIEKLAQLLVSYSADVQPGNQVVIEGGVIARTPSQKVGA